MDIEAKFILSAQHYQRMNKVIAYVDELKKVVNQKILRSNGYEGSFAVVESERLSEHVLKSFVFAPLFDPLLTFATDLEFKVDDKLQSLQTLGLYIELKQIFSEVRAKKFLSKDVVFYNLFKNYSLAQIDEVLDRMFLFLKVVSTNINAIYSLAVGLYYGPDSESLDLEIKELRYTYPYLESKNLLRTSSGELFAYLFIVAAQSFYTPQISKGV